MSKNRSIAFRELVGPRRWSADEARAVLVAAKQSGLSMPAFAEQHGLDPQRVYWWRRRLERVTEPAAPRRFEEVTLHHAVAGAVDRGRDARFEIELRSGRVVRVGASFDDDTLRRLLAVVDGEGDAC